MNSLDIGTELLVWYFVLYTYIPMFQLGLISWEDFSVLPPPNATATLRK